MKFTVVTPVEHDQKRYEPGSSIELKAEAAEPLLALGAIAKPASGTKGEAATKPDGEQPLA